LYSHAKTLKVNLPQQKPVLLLGTHERVDGRLLLLAICQWVTWTFQSVISTPFSPVLIKKHLSTYAVAATHD